MRRGALAMGIMISRVLGIVMIALAVCAVVAWPSDARAQCVDEELK